MNADRNHTTTTTANDLGKQGDSFSQRDHLPVLVELAEVPSGLFTLPASPPSR